MGRVAQAPPRPHAPKVGIDVPPHAVGIETVVVGAFVASIAVLQADVRKCRTSMPIACEAAAMRTAQVEIDAVAGASVTEGPVEQASGTVPAAMPTAVAGSRMPAAAVTETQVHAPVPMPASAVRPVPGVRPGTQPVRSAVSARKAVRSVAPRNVPVQQPAPMRRPSAQVMGARVA